MRLLDEILIVEFDNIDDYNKKTLELFDNKYKEVWNSKIGETQSMSLLYKKYGSLLCNVINYYQNFCSRNNKIVAIFTYFDYKKNEQEIKQCKEQEKQQDLKTINSLKKKWNIK